MLGRFLGKASKLYAINGYKQGDYGEAAEFWHYLMMHLASLPDHYLVQRGGGKTQEQHDMLWQACVQISNLVRATLQGGVAVDFICDGCGATIEDGSRDSS